MQIQVFLDFIDRLLWGHLLAPLLLGTGIFLSIRLRFVQFRYFIHGIECLRGKWNDEGKGEITYFQALSTALSATIGTGNIAGVATAIAAGGPGAVFWMWITAIFGMATKFSCCMLAVKFRKIDEKGTVAGGPMYYLEHGLKKRYLGILFAFFTAFASFGIGNMVQANSVVDPFVHAFPEHVKRRVSLAIGITMAVFVGIVIIGGVKRIAKVAERIVPFMAAVYVFAALTIIFSNLDKIPSVLKTIFKEAFGIDSITGGAAGYSVQKAIQFGIARGIFSNESGLGSAAIAHAAAKTKEPVREGSVAMLGPFIDTIVICTMTAIVIIISGMHKKGLDGAALSAKAFEVMLPNFGSYVVSFGLVLFAFTTMIGWSYYGDRAVYYLFGEDAVKIYRWIYVILIPIGAVIPLRLVWTLSDIMNALMAFPNLIGLIGLSGYMYDIIKDYERRSYGRKSLED